MNKRNIPGIMNPRQLNFWIALVLLAGAVFRTIQYLGTTSMWLDEVTSALNIQSRNFIQLATEKLDFNNVSPIGFLWLSKIAAILFGETDEAYRFIPWVASLLSLPLFYLLAKRFLGGFYLLTAVFIFSINLPSFLYAGQAKPYAIDLAAGIFLVLVAFKLMEQKISGWKLGFIITTGFILILSSFPATPIFLIITSILFIYSIRERSLPHKQQLLVTATVWLTAVAIILWYSFNMNQGVKTEMAAYWQNGFAPTNSILDFLVWIPKTIYKELGFFLAFFYADRLLPYQIIAVLLLVFSIIAILFMPQNRTIKLIILFTPVFAALALAILQKYPFANRVGFYASWPWIITGMVGLQNLVLWRPKIVRPGFAYALMGATLAVPILLLIFVPLFRPPYYTQPMQPVLKELKKQMQPGDIIYVYPKARWALRFYGPREGITDYIVAKGDTTVIPFFRDADKLKGNKRVWFIYTQWTQKQPYPDTIKGYLSKVIGKEIGKIPDPYGGKEDLEAAAYLYDLSGKE